MYALHLPYLCRKERLYLMNHDAFLQDVYSVVAAIPAGRVVTYGQIAYLVGRPQCSRMVGQAMHNVPEDLHLPCHGGVNSQGILVRAGRSKERCWKVKVSGSGQTVL